MPLPESEEGVRPLRVKILLGKLHYYDRRPGRKICIYVRIFQLPKPLWKKTLVINCVQRVLLHTIATDMYIIPEGRTVQNAMSMKGMDGIWSIMLWCLLKTTIPSTSQLLYFKSLFTGRMEQYRRIICFKRKGVQNYDKPCISGVWWKTE